MTTILLIEDNDVIRTNTAQILTLTGYAVQTAENGKVGVEKALENRPNLVICDIMMPVLDGYGVLHIFNKNPQLSGIPFTFLSAKIERSDFRKGMDLGADDYLTKPFEESELLSAIEGRLSRFQHIDVPEPALVPHSNPPEVRVRSAAGWAGSVSGRCSAVGQRADAVGRPQDSCPSQKALYLFGRRRTDAALLFESGQSQNHPHHNKLAD